MVFILHRGEVIALVKFTQVDFATGLGVPQTQRVGRVGVVAGDNLIVGDRQNLFGFQPAAGFAFHLHAATETHSVAGVVARELPRVTVLQPVIRRLFLTTVDDVLLKHAVIIANTVAAPRQRQRRQRVKEAGRQTPQTAVAKARVVLFVDQLFEV